jgi:hypothetical protein
MFLSCITVFKFLRFSVNFQTQICKFKQPITNGFIIDQWLSSIWRQRLDWQTSEQNEIHWRLAGPLIR